MSTDHLVILIILILKEKTSTHEAKHGNNIPEEEDLVEDGDSGDILSLQEKIGITDKIRKLTNEGLAALVRLIQKECAQALEEIDSEKLQIRVDSIDRRTYENILQLIESLSKIKDQSFDNVNKKIKVNN